MEKLRYNGLPTQFQKTDDVIEEIAKRKLTTRAGHVWRNKKSLGRWVIEERPIREKGL